MIIYSESWILPLIFRLEGSVMIRASMFAVPAACIAFCLVIVDEWYPEFRSESRLAELQKTQFWSASTFVLSILLGFRTNRAMARFWEGTGLLHQMRGEWFDSVSCCVTFSRAAVLQKRTDVMVFRHTIVRLMSLCHGSALEEIAGSNAEECETIDSFGLDNKTLQYLKECKEEHHFNRVEVLLHMIQSLITKNLDDGVLKIPPPILSRVYQTLSRGFVNLLNAKKIADTRFPFPYVQLITMLLVMHVVVTPVLISSLCQSRVWAPIFTFVPIFACFYLNFVGVELENPFGNDANDLPLDHFQAEMNKCLMMLLQDNADLIAGISKSRCLIDFAAIRTAMRPSSADERAAFDCRESRYKRLSHFSEYVDIYADEDDNYQDPVFSEQFVRSSLAWPEEKPNGKGKGAIPPKREESLNASVEQVAARSSDGAQSNASSSLVKAPEFAPTAPPIVEHVNKSLPNDSLSKSMMEFNNALQDLKRSAEAQVQDLNRSICAVKDFSKTLPVLLDSLSQQSRTFHKAHGVQESGLIPPPPTTPQGRIEENGGIGPTTGGSNKPVLPGPMMSMQITRVQIDPQDCPTVV